MKTGLYGRIVFGAAAALFGLIALMWRDSDTWQTLRQIWSVPFGALIGGCLMTAQITGGMGMQYPDVAHAGRDQGDLPGNFPTAIQDNINNCAFGGSRVAQSHGAWTAAG